MFEFNLTTFIFQIVNFVVLLVILARFFYRPVLKVMNKREQDIKDQLDSAAQKAEEADRRSHELDEREQSVQQEAVRLVAEARARADTERQQIIEGGRAEAAEAMERAKQRAEREQRGAVEASQKEIAHAAVSLAMNMVSGLAAEEVHNALVTRLADSLNSPDDGTTSLKAGMKEARLRTARELSSDQMERLTNALNAAAGNDVTVKVEVDPSLVAGCQVFAGDRLVDLTLKTLASRIETESISDGAEQ